MAEPAFRSYCPLDRDGCLAVFDSNVPVYFMPRERAEFTGFLDRLPGPYLVAEEPSGTVVACGGYAVNGETGIADMCWGMVTRSHHGRGIGKHLLRLRMEGAKQDPAVRLIQLITSQHTREFYERQGFRLLSVEPDGFGPGLDQCKMEWQRPASGERSG